MSLAERLLSYSLLSLITCKHLSSAPMTGISEEEEESNDKVKGLLNSDGAWCWRENCEGERMSYDTLRAH
jgi:sorting nexin-9/18/33